MLTEYYLPGGLERFLVDLAHALDPDRFELHILAKAPGLTEGLRRALPAYVVLHEPALLTAQPWQERLGASSWPAWLKLLPRAALSALHYLCLAANVPVLERLISAIRPDYLEIVNGGYPGGALCLAAAVAGRRARVPWVDMFVLSYPFPRRMPLLDALIDRRVAEALDSLTANSDATRDGLASVRGMSSPKSRTVYTGIGDSDPPGGRGSELARSWRTEPGQTLIGMLSVFVPIKGHRTLLEAAARVAPRHPEARWVLAGDGPTREAMQAYCRGLGIEDRVVFPGRHEGPGEEVTAALDVVVHPSVQESFPYAVLEAMRAGKPVIATRIAGIPEQIEDGVSGLLVAPGDPDALASAMERVLREPGAARSLGDAARRRFQERFTLDRMRRSFEQDFARDTGSVRPGAAS